MLWAVIPFLDVVSRVPSSNEVNAAREDTLIEVNEEVTHSVGS